MGFWTHLIFAGIDSRISAGARDDKNFTPFFLSPKHDCLDATRNKEYSWTQSKIEKNNNTTLCYSFCLLGVAGYLVYIC